MAITNEPMFIRLNIKITQNENFIAHTVTMSKGMVADEHQMTLIRTSIRNTLQTYASPIANNNIVEYIIKCFKCQKYRFFRRIDDENNVKISIASRTIKTNRI